MTTPLVVLALGCADEPHHHGHPGSETSVPPPVTFPTEPTEPTDPGTGPEASGPVDVLAVPRADEQALRTWLLDVAHPRSVRPAGDLDGDGVDDVAMYEEEEYDSWNGYSDGWLRAWPVDTDDDASIVAQATPVPVLATAWSAPLGVQPGDGPAGSRLWIADEESAQLLAWDGTTWSTSATVDSGAGYLPGPPGDGADITGDGVQDATSGWYLLPGPFDGSYDWDRVVEVPADLSFYPSLSLGPDLDGDGIDDGLLVDSDGAHPVTAVGGAAEVGPLAIADVESAFAAGDVDGDGNQDLAGFANEHWSLIAEPWTASGALSDLATADFQASYAGPSDLVALDDLDADGFADLAFHQEILDYGILRVAYGPPTGSIDPSALDGWRGPTPLDGFGQLAFPVVLDGAPVVAGVAPTFSHGGDGTSGAVFLLPPP